jgi:hypothetical protein
VRLMNALLPPNPDERSRRRTIAIAEAGWRAGRLASTVGLIALDYKYHHYSSGATAQQGKVRGPPYSFRPCLWAICLRVATWVARGKELHTAVVSVLHHALTDSIDFADPERSR